MDSGRKKELKILGGLMGLFAVLYWLPIEAARFQGALIEAFTLAKWYAREHVLLCLVPAFFIAGAIGVFISQNAVMKYFGPKAPKWLSYSVASVSGTILAVCSCTVLPLFGGIYMRGAGLGPAAAFLYSGPAINVLAIVLTARVLGWPLGLARAVGAVLFSVVIGLLMHFIFRKEERVKAAQTQDVYLEADESDRPLWQTALYFLSMVGILVFANWGRPNDCEFKLRDGQVIQASVVRAPSDETAPDAAFVLKRIHDEAGKEAEVVVPASAVVGREPVAGVWTSIWRAKWIMTALFAVMFGACLWRFFGVRPLWIALAALPPAVLAWALPQHPVAAFASGALGLAVLTSLAGPQMREWRDQTWGFSKQILPLLFLGVLAAGFFLGSPDSVDAGIIPNVWIEALVGDSPVALLGLLGGSGSAPGWLDAFWPIWTNFFAAVAGALMYFATLTEVPILRGLLDSGMGQGPALALLLAGPALSLPNMLVINSILGPKKTLTFIGLVVIMATISGIAFGIMMG
jgi:uncharacterized protein